MEQPEEVEEYHNDDAQINQCESKIKASYMETKQRENTNTNPRRQNAGKVVKHLQMKFGGKKYNNQFTSTSKKRKYFMHDMHKIDVDVTFKHMTANKGIKNNGHREVAAMYK